MTFIITEACIDEKDASCVDVCPVDCIHEGEDQFYIDPIECVDCYACVPVCPVKAIFPDDEVPERYIAYIDKNYLYFGVTPPAR
ncbi:MAG: 4Fe-4S binding protein [bacterium]|nr:4Fe-4S binding protein [bacterium]